ncbi:MAG: U32 family peptidase [Candidatus Woesearchaeota archaeon]
MNMKIVAPASSIEEVKKFNELEVDEIYFGLKSLEDKEIEDRKWDSVNERFEKKGNFTNVEEIKKVYELNKNASKSAELSLTLNRAFYTNDQLKRALNQIKKTKKYINNYIIADPSLINPVKKIAPNLNIKLSCISVCLNPETAKFFKNRGIKRIALPRHLTLKEIKEIKKESDIELESMILNQFCRNIDGFCYRCHIPVPGKDRFITNCNISFRQKIFNIDSNKREMKNADRNIASILNRFNPFCGICFLKRLKKLGVNHLKIVGRSNSTERKVNDIKFIQNALSFSDIRKSDYIKKCKKLFEEYYGFKCKNNCYFD